MKHALKVSLAMLVGAGLAGPAAADSFNADLVAAAKKEGAIVIYHSINRPVLKELCDKFEAKFGIKTDCTRKSTGGISKMIAAEKLAGQLRCDIVSAGDGSLFIDWRKDGLLEPYKSVNYDSYRSETKDPDSYSSPSRMTYYGIEYSTKAIAEADVPKDWPDVLNPKWAGKIGIINPDSSGPGRLFLAAMVEKYGWEFIEKLAKLKPLMINSSSSAATMLIQGEVVMTIPGSEHTITEKKAEGQPVGIVYPKSGLLTKDSRVGICKNPPHPNAAKLWIDFETSAEGQSIITSVGGYPPVRADVKLAHPRPDGVFDSDKVIVVPEQKLMEVGAEQRAKFQKIMRAAANG